MKITYKGKNIAGHAIDAAELELPAAAVVRAVRGEESPVTVEAPDPAPVHERIGYVRPEMGLSTRTALAAAARSRGLSAPQDAQIAALRAELASLECPAVSTREARRKAAEQGTETARLRERVATLRGRLQAARERDGDISALEGESANVVQRLSEAETEQVAAQERFESARADAREAWDIRDQRLRLEDRLANLERTARTHLVEQVEPAYIDAVAAVPGPPPTEPFEADTVTAALAIGRVAALSAPVVLDCGRFDSAEAAASWLDAPVIRL